MYSHEARVCKVSGGRISSSVTRTVDGGHVRVTGILHPRLMRSYRSGRPLRALVPVFIGNGGVLGGAVPLRGRRLPSTSVTVSGVSGAPTRALL